jgi:hypothetical protein
MATVDDLKAKLDRIGKKIEESRLLDAQLQPDYTGPVYTYVAGVLVYTASPEYAAWYDRVYGGSYDCGHAA